MTEAEIQAVDARVNRRRRRVRLNTRQAHRDADAAAGYARSIFRLGSVAEFHQQRTGQTEAVGLALNLLAEPVEFE